MSGSVSNSQNSLEGDRKIIPRKIAPRKIAPNKFFPGLGLGFGLGLGWGQSTEAQFSTAQFS